MTSTPIHLTPRAAREQRTFRALLNAMARPGTVGELPLTGSDAWFGPLVAVAEALVDHEVSFAALPERADLVDAVLRQTGSRVAAPAEADYLFCGAESLAQTLRLAKDGPLEYPERNGTVVCLVEAISASGASAITEHLMLAGPGIRDVNQVWVAGFSAEAQAAFEDRNALPPMGLDVILVAPDGSFTCLSRYTRFTKEAS